METIKESVDLVLKNNEHLDRASLFQMQCFILQKEPTTQGKLHQCLLELKSRQDALAAIQLEIEEQHDRLELLDISLARKLEIISEDELGLREKKVITRQTERQKTATVNHLDKLEVKKKNIEEESLFWMSAFDQLTKREALKQWDDPEVQKEYWNEKLRREINIRLLLRQLPDIETMRTVMCLPDDSNLKKKTIEMLQDCNNKAAALTQKQAG